MFYIMVALIGIGVAFKAAVKGGMFVWHRA